MQWTKAFPANQGWYWLRRPNFDDEIIKVEDSEDEMTVWSGDFCYENIGPAEWAGPIPKPDEGP